MIDLILKIVVVLVFVGLAFVVLRSVGGIILSGLEFAVTVVFALFKIVTWPVRALVDWLRSRK